MPCLAISASVTSYGRQMIMHTREMVTTRFSKANGYEADCDVIYGDTDSVMVNFRVRAGLCCCRGSCRGCCRGVECWVRCGGAASLQRRCAARSGVRLGPAAAAAARALHQLAEPRTLQPPQPPQPP
jgi:hypothetical protein